VEEGDGANDSQRTYPNGRIYDWLFLKGLVAIVKILFYIILLFEYSVLLQETIVS
jgi:hypothetical protein